VAILELKNWGSNCEAKEKVGGQHKCLSLYGDVSLFED